MIASYSRAGALRVGRIALVVWRVTTLVTASLAMLLIGVIAFWPGQLDAYGDQERREYELRWFAQWQKLVRLAAVAPDEARVLTADVSSDLREVHKLDRLSTMVRLVEGMRYALAMKTQDMSTAIASASRMVAMDDRDIDAALKLARALALDDMRSGEAIALLEPLAASVATHAELVQVLCRLHLARGDGDAAVRVLTRAASNRSDPSMQVQWGDKVQQATWCMPHRVSATTVAWHFTVDKPRDALAFRVTPTATVMLTDPVITFTRAGRSTTAALLTTPHRLTHATFDGRHLYMDGSTEARIELTSLPFGDEPITLTLTAGYETALPRWLCTLALGSIDASATSTLAAAVVAQLRELRRMAFCGLPVIVHGMGSDPLLAPLHVMASRNGDEFAVRFSMPPSVTQVQIHLPEGLQVSYSGLRLDRGSVACGVASAWHNLERADGGRQTGPKPSLTFVLPQIGNSQNYTLRGGVE